MNTEITTPENNKHGTGIQIKKRSPIAAALFTVLVPGLGHLYCGEIKRGFVFFILFTGFTVILEALIKFYPGYIIIIFAVSSCIPLGLYILIESIIISLKKSNYTLQFFNNSKYYIAVIVTAIFYVTPIENIFKPESFSTPTGSMINTVIPGDKFFENDLYYGFRNPITGKYLIQYKNPRSGDIVKFKFYGFPEESPKNPVHFFKRILACPGDSFVIKNRLIYLNNETFKYSSHLYYEYNFTIKPEFSDPVMFPRGFKWNADNYGPVTVPKHGETVSLDTSNINMWKKIIRDEGNKLEIRNDRIFINDVEKYSYTFKYSYYFMIGDNWYNSLDSRYFGFINENDIKSKLTMIYFSWDSNIPLKDFSKRLNSIRWDRIGKMIE